MDSAEYSHSEGYYENEGESELHDSLTVNSSSNLPEESQEVKRDFSRNGVEPEENHVKDESTATLIDSEDASEEVVDLVTKKNSRRGRADDKENEDDFEDELRFSSIEEEPKITDPVVLAHFDLIEKETPTTDLEIAFSVVLERKQSHIDRLTTEIIKLKQFISKRKQTYKRKRKDDGAPTRALSAYNIFIQDRFARLAKENEKALTSEDMDATMKRVPPSSLVSTTGNEWKLLPLEVKARYEERAKADRKRYEEQMAKYHAPDKQSNRKRNKTGYNMFFSAHVLRLKQTESGVPSERGSVARLVGTAWKQLSADEKAYYEREADTHNGMNPVKEGEEDEEEDEIKRQQMEYHMQLAAQNEHIHMHGMVPPPIHPAMQHTQPHDGRHHHAYYPAHMYAPPHPYGHYDYSQHHQRHNQARAQGYQQIYPPAQRHAYDT